MDIGVGETSLLASFQKDRGDLARTLIWSKRAADEIATKFESIEGMNTLSIQIIGQTCNVGAMKILFALSDALSIEDDVQVWLTLDETFN
ncbi:hypothetical protein KI688_001781 [Linnemannia hyalina]|uniref:Uncharacterized protein n=1 Tax=Linnemannia hyalina TaxID=64524 RepID=A0A9P7XRW7_9FUNG|nr:hypothetical protein KI688_001781 [Linnemannia hyalina]